MASIRQLTDQLQSKGPLGARKRRAAAEALAATIADSDAIGVLAEAVVDGSDTQVTAIAMRAIEAADFPLAIDAVCRVWVRTRNEDLASLIGKMRWVARRPPEIRVLTALKSERWDLLWPEPALVRELLIATGDVDPDLAQRAWQSLFRDDIVETVSTLGNIDAVARQAAQQGFLPSDPKRRALWLFLAGQWDDYDAIDGDHAFLRELYDGSNQPLRNRMAVQAQAGSRLDWLRMVAGERGAWTVASMSPMEWDVAISILEGTAYWDDLWSLIDEASPELVRRILASLDGAEWVPSCEPDRSDYEGLQALARACNGHPPDLVEPIKSKVLLKDPDVSDDPVKCLAITPDDRFLVAGGWGPVCLWRLPDGELHAVLRGDLKGYATSCLAVSPDGRFVAVGTIDGSVWIWHLPIGELVAKYSGHREAVTTLAITPDGSVLVSGSLDGTVRLWRLSDGSALAVLTDTGKVSHLTFTPDGALLVTGCRRDSHDVQVWRLSDANLHTTLEGTEFANWALMPDGRSLISARNFGNIVLWDLLAGEPLKYQPYSLEPEAVAVVPDGSTVASAGDRGVVLYRMPEMEPNYVSHKDTSCLAIVAGGRLVATADRDGTVRLWRLPDGAAHAVLEGHTDMVWCLGATSDGRLLASGCEDGTVRLWESAMSLWFRTPIPAIALEEVEAAIPRAGSVAVRARLEFVRRLAIRRCR